MATAESSRPPLEQFLSVDVRIFNGSVEPIQLVARARHNLKPSKRVASRALISQRDHHRHRLMDC